MNKYNPHIHHRRSIRLKGYDYTQVGLYFITLCCQNRAHLFGCVKNGQMQLNAYGKIAQTEWYNTENIRDNCRIHESIIMPNHIHGIIEITRQKGKKQEIGKFKSPSQSIGAIIRGFKIATIKKIKDFIKEKEISTQSGESKYDIGDISTVELQFDPTDPTAPSEFDPTTEIIKSLNYKIWQRNYYENIIRNEKAYRNISNYIINNPKKWKEDKFK